MLKVYREAGIEVIIETAVKTDKVRLRSLLTYTCTPYACYECRYTVLLLVYTRTLYICPSMYTCCYTTAIPLSAYIV